MSYMVSLALPVLPGKADRVRNIGAEVEQHRAEWDRLCREAGAFRHYNMTLQQGPGGDLCIYSMVVEEPGKVRGSFGNSAYDRWWTGFVRDVHGVDLTAAPAPALPPSVFSWHAP